MNKKFFDTTFVTYNAFNDFLQGKNYQYIYETIRDAYIDDFQDAFHDTFNAMATDDASRVLYQCAAHDAWVYFKTQYISDYYDEYIINLDDFPPVSEMAAIVESYYDNFDRFELPVGHRERVPLFVREFERVALEICYNTTVEETLTEMHTEMSRALADSLHIPCDVAEAAFLECLERFDTEDVTLDTCKTYYLNEYGEHEHTYKYDGAELTEDEFYAKLETTLSNADYSAEYNTYLDDRFGSIAIGENEFWASSILSTLAPEEYSKLVDEFKADFIAKFKDNDDFRKSLCGHNFEKVKK